MKLHLTPFLKGEDIATYPLYPLTRVKMAIDDRPYYHVTHQMNTLVAEKLYRYMNSVKAAMLYSELGFAETLYQIAVRDTNYPINQVYYISTADYKYGDF